MLLFLLFSSLSGLWMSEALGDHTDHTTSIGKTFLRFLHSHSIKGFMVNGLHHVFLGGKEK